MHPPRQQRQTELSQFFFLWELKKTENISHDFLAICSNHHGELVDHQRYNQPLKTHSQLCAAPHWLLFMLWFPFWQSCCWGELLYVETRSGFSPLCLLCWLQSARFCFVCSAHVCVCLCATYIRLVTGGCTAFPPVSTQSWNTPGRMVTDTQRHRGLMKNNFTDPLIIPPVISEPNKPAPQLTDYFFNETKADIGMCFHSAQIRLSNTG